MGCVTITSRNGGVVASHQSPVIRRQIVGQLLATGDYFPILLISSSSAEGDTGPPRNSSITCRVGRSRPKRKSRGEIQPYHVESLLVVGPCSSRVLARMAALSMAPTA